MCIRDSEPTPLWQHFDDILTVPRASKDEERIRAHILAVAKNLNLKYQTDAAGNVVISKPGSTGHEQAPTTILQSHLDMVQEKNSDVDFDFSKDAVGLANEWYASQTNLSFKEGNAESLPLEDNSQDIIYNVESSHCYGNVGTFVKEVYRALRTGGNFCWTDFRDKPTMGKLHEIFLDSGFQIVSKREITSEVLVALDEINESKVQGIRESVPRTMRKSFETFAGVQGTPVYEAFKAGNLHYHRYLMVKPE